jgi:hypothetical protein
MQNIAQYVTWVFLCTSLVVITALMTRTHYTDIIAKLQKSNSELIKEQAEGITVAPSQLAEFKRITMEHAVLNEDRNKLISHLRDTYPGVVAGRYAGLDLCGMVTAIIREEKQK